ncbi:MAG: putative Fe-S cluster assembly protein SufT [Candidatus Porifericomitaceae bacterium WSBS_2022_MAG_OTU9]
MSAPFIPPSGIAAPEPIRVSRDCDAVLIPSGTPIFLPKNTEVFITQALGGSYTVNVSGSLARISGDNADAIGMDMDRESVSEEPFVVQGDGSVDESQVWEQLKNCYDPEIPINVVDLGLIYDCRITPLGDGKGASVEIDMTLTAPGCGMGQFLADDVRARVMSVANVAEATVQLTFDPPWTQDRMSEAARLDAGLL